MINGNNEEDYSERIIGVIPARYESSRLPGKPLADICGKPMIWWVYTRASDIPDLDEVYVATDDERIVDVCNKYDIPSMLTSKTHRNGSERISEFASLVCADIYVTIQGDEPLFDRQAVSEVIKTLKMNNDLCALLRTPYRDPVDVINCTGAKVVTDLMGYALYFTRLPVPYPKAALEYTIWDPIGVMAWRRELVLKYKDLPMGPLEMAEDIEFLRLVENGYKIKVGTVNYDSLEVNTSKDLDRVRKYIMSHEEEMRYVSK